MWGIPEEVYCVAYRITDGHTVSPLSDCYILVPEPGLILSLVAGAIMLRLLQGGQKWRRRDVRERKQRRSLGSI